MTDKSGVELPESEPNFSKTDAVRSAIGQATHSYAPIQLSRYVTTVANSGTCYDLTLIDQVKDVNGNVILDNHAKVRNTVNIANSTWKAVHNGMYRVVNGSRSSIGSMFSGMKVKIAGKTGTAQQSKLHANHAYFVSYAPYKNPEISVTCVIPNGFTSSNAAQTARDVYKYYFSKNKKKVSGKIKMPESIQRIRINLSYEEWRRSMSELVAMKGTKSGIVIVLNEEAAFEELKQAVSEKFKESAAFWGEATKAVSFQGKKLSDDEKMQLVDCIQENCHLLIPCIMEEDEALETAFQNSIENRQEEIDYSTGQFFKGNLRSGQVLDVETSIIIIGDVKAGAKVVSKGNVIILGSLKGNVYAGSSGNTNAFVVALDMDPVQIRIADTIARSPDKPRKKKEKETKIAFWEDGNIYIEPLDKDVMGIFDCNFVIFHEKSGFPYRFLVQYNLRDCVSIRA